MTPLQHAIEAYGGLIAAHEIRALLGVGAAGISRAVASSEIVRVRQGWYANPWLGYDEQHAARVGGQLACASAAARLGLWDPLIPATHVCVPANAARLRSPTSHRTRLGTDARVEVHWTGLDPDAHERSSARPAASDRSRPAGLRRPRWRWPSPHCTAVSCPGASGRRP